jgi:hypothetical protein
MRTKEFTVYIHFCEPFMPIHGHIRESALEAENRIRTAKSNIEKTLTLNAKNKN